MSLTQEELNNKISRYKCCSGIIAYKLFKAEQYGFPNVACLYQHLQYLNRSIKALAEYTPAGTVLSYDIDACADVDLTDMTSLLDDSMTVNISVVTSSGTQVIATLVGDFLGDTLSEFIDALVLEINNSNPDYTATNNNPSIEICFSGTSLVNLIGGIVEIELVPYYYLRGEANNLPYRTASTALGYLLNNAQSRTAFVPGTQTLFVFEGDSIQLIYPGTTGGNTAPAGSTNVSTNADYTGATIGSTYAITIAPGLTTKYFAPGATFLWNRRITDLHTAGNTGAALDGCATNLPYSNFYVLTCQINFTGGGYNSGTGVMNFTVTNVTWNNQAIASIPTITPAVNTSLGCNVNIGAGTFGGTNIGVGRVDTTSTNWIFQSQGAGYSTVSIWNITNPTSTTAVATYVRDFEKKGAEVTDSVYSPTNNYIYTSSYGEGNAYACMQRLDLTTLISSNTSLGVTGIIGLKEHPNHNIYVYSGATLFKVQQVGVSPFHTSAADITIPCGTISFKTDGSIYTCSQQAVRPVFNIITPVKVPYDQQDTFNPLLNPVLTASDYQIQATLGPLLKDFGAAVPGQAFVATIASGLNALNDIWIPGATFIIYYTPDLGVTIYSLLCTITILLPSIPLGYNNINGDLSFDITSISKTIPPALPVIQSSLPNFGAVNWIWVNSPFRAGVIDQYYHEPTGRMFCTRDSNIGGILTSYDFTAVGQAAIEASRIIHLPPTTTDGSRVILSGKLNYQSVARDKFLMSNTASNKIYIFDPNTLSYDPRSVSQPNGGCRDFSYTGDIDEYNMFAATTRRISIVSYRQGEDLDFQGSFDGSVEENLSLESSNCLTEDEVDNIIQTDQNICCDVGCCTGDGISDDTL